MRDICFTTIELETALKVVEELVFLFDVGIMSEQTSIDPRVLKARSESCNEVYSIIKQLLNDRDKNDKEDILLELYRIGRISTELINKLNTRLERTV